MSPAEFWNGKILEWELKRYSTESKNSLQVRMNKTVEILNQEFPASSVTDLGCGSGILLKRLAQAGERPGLIGVDISSTALERARQRELPQVKWHLGSCLDFEPPPESVVVALGLSDWLTEAELQSLLKGIYPRPFIMSFSDSDKRFWRYLHQVYVCLSYGWRSRGYVPRYYQARQLKAMALLAGYQNVKLETSEEMGLGSILIGRP